MKKTQINFDTYFSNIYEQRWASLKESLLSPKKQVIRNTFSQNFDFSYEETLFDYPVYTENLKGVFEHHKTDEGLKKYYIMDPASLIAANAINIEPDDFVLDMCSAPGGKCLILLEKLKDGQLWANEISSARREKLKSVIQSYVPKNFRENIFIKGKDGSRYGLMHPDTFDKIIIDAPCSGEQHILKTPKELEKWSPKRTKRLAQTQYSLLCSGMLALKEQGELLYSTCSISPLENDHVIEKLIQKKNAKLLEPKNLPKNIEKTEFGYIFLPDKSCAGPIYFSLLTK